MTSIFVRRLATSALALLALASTGQAQDYTAEFNRQWGLRMIGVDHALALGLDGRGVLVGVTDTGLYTGSQIHPEFAGRLNGLSFDGYSGGPLDEDLDSHGTHVAGIIAANRDGFGMMGVASGSTIVPLRILGGIGNNGDTVTAPLQYGLANGVRIFNASWGRPSSYDRYYTLDANGDIIGVTPRSRAQILADYAFLVPTYEQVVASDGVMIFANGNSSNSPRELGFLPLSVDAAMPYYLPQLQRGWIAVTALGPTDLAVYSQTCSVAMMWCISAPGGDQSLASPPPGTDDGGILSTYPQALSGQQAGVHEYLIDGRLYTSYNGTSMAAPHVSGALAIAKQLYPNASYQDLRSLVLQTATDIGAAGIDPIYGWGLLNVRNIVNAASPLAGTVYAQQSWARQGVVNHLIDGLNPNAAVERGGEWGYWVMPLGLSGAINNANPALSANLGAAGFTAGVEGGIAPDW